MAREKSPPNMAAVVRSVKQATAPVKPTTQQIADYNRYSGHPNSNHKNADGTIVPRPLGGSK